MQEENQNKDKKMYFANLVKVFDRVPRKFMEWALRKTFLPEIFINLNR